ASIAQSPQTRPSVPPDRAQVPLRNDVPSSKLRLAPIAPRTCHGNTEPHIELFQEPPQQVKLLVVVALVGAQDTQAIQLYLGHKNIQHTVRYTELAAGRFKDFWKD